ncbi:androgen-binding protein homolog isoform X2 [Lemur catta]|uniref:androgen-binding protein homolog isoform X2 n=1 Tax=Lemur catta TaxID=9447 RepID=UPI001E26D2D4|nr:androgen-binding protein homolog isoform X2 [Lemur catta]
MKGTLLVLALLVTGELGFKTEACPAFYGIFSLLALGNKQLLDISLDLVNATKPEKAGFEKLQACYNERGVKAKLLDLKALSSITLSKECISSALNMVKNDVKQRLSKLNPLGR